MLKRFNDDQARAIITRAIELDSRAGTITADELRDIASEIGVTRESLERALHEHALTRQARQAVVGRRAATAVVSLGMPMGLAVGVLMQPGSVSGALVALGLTGVAFVASGALLVLQGKAATLRSFHLKNAVLWAGVAAGSALSTTLIGTGIPSAVLIGLSWSIRGWVATSILGSAAVIAIRRALRPSDSGLDQDMPEGRVPAPRTVLARVATRALGWLTRPFRREVAQAQFGRREFGRA
jgi:hypothetical protein